MTAGPDCEAWGARLREIRQRLSRRDNLTFWEIDRLKAEVRAIERLAK